MPATVTPVIKQPAERKIQRFAFGMPAGVPLVSLVSSSVTAAGRVPEVLPLVIESSSVSTTEAELLLSGGTAGELYAVDVLVEDAAGHRYESEAEILVLDLAFRAAGASAAQYLTIEDFVARTGIDEAVRLTDEAGAGAIDARRLDAALLDAEAEVNSYLAVRYAVPLAPPAPPPVPALVFDLALARLYRGELPDGVAQKRDAARAILKDLAAGKAVLAGAAAPSAASPAPVVVRPAERVFGRLRLRSY
ncbi:phage protein Gp36 family protein [Thermaurantiacus tibetensis]|uniref:phage protein Gp36 family protein n=1 Tax=Thermaurantiacus tibetensis TaxID=2759035 RepID=UPI00188E2891|nr:phage protein Gp36 family protein [Thermaurantiacus tibetensis]